MTPPINIDGSTVDAITIDGTEVTEVTADGEVVFGSAIPDSDINQYRMEAGSGTTLSDSRGGLSATLYNGAGWASSTVGFFDQATTYDNSQNQYWQTDAGIDINQTQTSVWVWFQRSDGGDNATRLIQTGNNPAGQPSNGYGIQVRDQPGDNGEVSVYHHNSGTSNTALSDVGTTPINTDLFLGLGIDGDNCDLYVWDRSQDTQIINNSGSASRGITTTETVTGMAGDGFYMAGQAIAAGFNDSQYTETEFKDIYDATK